MRYIYTASTGQSNNQTYSVDQRNSSVQDVDQHPEILSTLKMISTIQIKDVGYTLFGILRF